MAIFKRDFGTKFSAMADDDEPEKELEDDGDEPDEKDVGLDDEDDDENLES